MSQSIINLTALILTIISIIIAIVQTIKIKNLKKIRDTQLQLIWLKSKELSYALYNNKKNDSFKNECFTNAQRLEELIVLLIVNLGKFDATTINKLREEDFLDDYDIKLLKRLTKSLK